jgi:hypothetical protein
MALLLSSIQRGRFDGVEQISLDKLVRWGRGPFERFQVNGSQLIGSGS